MGPSTSEPSVVDEPGKSKGSRWKSAVALLKVSVLFVASCVVTYQLEHYAESVLARGEEPAGVSQTVFGVSGAYTLLVTTAPKHAVARRTVLIPIDPGSDPTAWGLSGNICEQRKYLTRLLLSIAAQPQKPVAIVIDKSFAVDACSTYSEQDPTGLFMQTVDTVSKDVPIIVAVYIDVDEPPSSHQGGAGNISPSLKFGPTVREGIANFPQDSNQLPLGWNAYDPSLKKIRWYSSVALEAAAAAEKNIFDKNPSLKGMMEGGQTPYMNLIPSARMDAIASGRFICLSPSLEREKQLADRCKKLAPMDSEAANGPARHPSPEYIAGKVVLIGDRSAGVDRHNTALGNIAGLELQATAIEALLEENYFRPVPYQVNLALGFLLFAGVHWSLLHKKSAVCILRFAVVLLFFGVVVGLSARLFHTYLTPAAGLLAMVLKFIGWIGERIGQHGEHHAI